MPKKAGKERSNLLLRPLAPEIRSYYQLESRRVERGLQYWVRHGSSYWDGKAKSARTQEARYKAKTMRRIGATFVLSARYYLNSLSMLTFLAEQIDDSNEVLLSVKGELEDVGVLKKQMARTKLLVASRERFFQRIKRAAKKQQEATEELFSYIA